jgi:LuxR family maltose regulon positive regulatory protein
VTNAVTDRAGSGVLPATTSPATRRHHGGVITPGAARATTAPARDPQEALPTLLEAKLNPPRLGPHLIQRRELLEVVDTTDAAVVAVCAPAGYGKTTFLAQVAAVAEAPVAWLSLDETDNDPTHLLAGLATGLDRCLSLDARVLNLLRSPAPHLFSQLLPCLVNSLGRGPRCVVILDDIQRVTSPESEAVLEYLCEHLASGVRLVIAGRQLAALPLGRLRARRMLLELGPDVLRLSPEQARELFDGVGVQVTLEAQDALYGQTEGWPAGTYLAALAARKAADPDAATRAFDGADRTIIDFLTTEQLAGESSDRLEFLERTSVLEQLSAPLCDAILERDDSAAVLAAMEQSNGFVIALDRRRQWYRYHQLFGQVLRAELARREPGQVREVHQRAARWYEEQGNVAQAIEHAVSARDERRVAELLAGHLQDLFVETPLATLCRWLETLSDGVLRECPPLLVAGAWATFQFGDLEKTRRSMRLLDGLTFDGQGPLGEVSDASAVALLRAILAWDGVSRIAKQADVVRGLEPRVSRTYRAAGLCLGVSLFLQERRTAARDLLEDAAEIAECPVDIRALAHALLALLDLEERRPKEAELHIHVSSDYLGAAGRLDGLVAAPLAATVAWLDLAGHNDRVSARLSFDRAVALLPRAAVVPWLSIYLHIVLGRMALELDDVAAAESLLAAARRGLMRHPDAGELPHMLASAERAQEAAQGGSRRLVEPLTQAELRVLELAPTCLSIEEIGRTLCVSKNTVKTHLKAIYAKLTVASRSDAVERARTLRLIA